MFRFLGDSGYDLTVRIWDIATGQARAVLAGHKEWVKAMAVAPDGSWLATGDANGTLRIWDAVTGEPQTMMRVENRILACASMSRGEIAVAGTDGLYIFEFRNASTTPTAAPGRDP
jgi:WD40 repeat protein